MSLILAWGTGLLEEAAFVIALKGGRFKPVEIKDKRWENMSMLTNSK